MKSRKEIKNYLINRGIYQFLSLAALGFLLIAGSAFLGPLIVDSVKDPGRFREIIDSYGAAGRLVFIGIQMLQVLFALIPGEVVEVGAGYAFGPYEGLLLCLAGVTVASALIFFLVRKLGHRLAEVLISSKRLEKFKFLHNQKQLTTVIFLLYLIPGTPKDLITYFAGLTEIKPSTFLWMSTLARIPSILSSTYAGTTLSSKNYTATIIIFAVSAAVSLIGMLLYRYLVYGRKKNHQDEADTEQPV